MKTFLLFLIPAMLLLGSCEVRQNTPQTYFKKDTVTVQTGGIRMIPIHTAKGDFHVWTKRVGYNPRIKLLLLHGGPGATHVLYLKSLIFLKKELKK